MKKFLFTLLFLLVCFLPNSGASAASQTITVNTSTRTLAFYENGSLIREFPVAIGKSSTPTPEGSFSVVNKIMNRPYYKKNIAGGAKGNPLGDRWIGLNINGTPGDTYAIHGNSNESSIGKAVSNGCIRMHNADIRWLYDRIQTGAAVVINRSPRSYAESSTPAPMAVTASADTSKTTDALNVRTAPNLQASRIAVLPANTPITIYETRDGWHYMTANGISGWVSADYVSGSGTSRTTALTSGQTHVPLNVRSAPGIESKRITTLRPGTSFAILEASGSWYHISALGITGWVLGEYVSSL